MATDTLRLILALMVISSGYCYCPIDKMVHTEECGFRFHCNGNIRGIRLSERCQGSTNHPITVDLTLTDAIERFDDDIDPEILMAITSLRVTGSWPQTKLSFLQDMYRLQNLYLVENKMEDLGRRPFYHLNQLEILDLSRNRLSDISNLFEFELYPNRLKKLNLAFNVIEEVSEDALNELSSLTELDLSYNLITTLDEEPFSNLTSLEILKLNNNKITDLNGALDDLLNLKHLYLKGNEIVHISDQSLKRMDHLETFDISRNRLKTLTPDILIRHWDHFGNRSICKMTLSGNLLTFVPNATTEEYLARFTRSYKKFNSINITTELDLSQNSISDIEYNAFQSLLRLTNLDLSHNKLKSFYVDPDNLSFVRFLNLSNNQLTHLYFESFRSMNNLLNLDLSDNKLDYIPDYTFVNNQNLKVLNMTYNDFQILRNVHIKIFHPDGGVLDLSNNGLTRLTIPTGEALRMSTLIIHSNEIIEPRYISLQHQSELRHLDMSENNIQRLNSSSLNLPLNLSYLDLNNNKIQEIGPGTFHRVARLKTLRLARNNLGAIEYGSFQGLALLLNLDLSYNNIHYLDSKLLKDLKNLIVLSVSYNHMVALDYRGWSDHKYDLKVHIDGNNFSCDWVGTALNDYNNNYSKMKPCVLYEAKTEHSLEGIPCKEASKELAELRVFQGVMTNEDRLLAINVKILEAIRDQTHYIKKSFSRLSPFL